MDCREADNRLLTRLRVKNGQVEWEVPRVALANAIEKKEDSSDTGVVTCEVLCDSADLCMVVMNIVFPVKVHSTFGGPADR